MNNIFTILAVIMMSACQTSAAPASGGAVHHAVHDEFRPYDEAADARADIAAAMAAIQGTEKKAIIAMGTNLCHDSRGLAAAFQKNGRVHNVIKSHYEVVYVDVGRKDRNIDIAQEFGVDDIVGTPTVFVLSPEGEVLNLETAPTWRNADSRSEDEIFLYFRDFAHSKEEN